MLETELTFSTQASKLRIYIHYPIDTKHDAFMTKFSNNIALTFTKVIPLQFQYADACYFLFYIICLEIPDGYIAYCKC